MNQTTKNVIYISFAMAVLVLISKKLFASNNNTELVNGKNLIVGDSHAVMIGAKVKNAILDPKLAKSGWRVSNLIDALSNYPVSAGFSKVFISIGTNGQYSKNDKIEVLINKLKEKFPNATLYVFKGSHGWSASGNQAAALNQSPYYKRFQDAGVNVLNNGLGYFSTDAEAHSTSTNQAKAIINEINSYTIK